MKENTLFKLDLLQSYYLQTPARFGVTKQMLRTDKFQSKKPGQSSSSKSEKQKHKLLQLTRNEAFSMIKELQNESFEKKVHFMETKLQRTIIRVLKKEKQKISQKLQNDDKSKDSELKEQLTLIDSLFKDNFEILKKNIKHKIFKSIIQTFPTKLDVKNDNFIGIPDSSINFINNMKESNPYKTNGVKLNNLFSKIMSDKSVKDAMDNIKSFEIIWGPKTYSKNNDDELKEFDGDDEEEEEEKEEVEDNNVKSNTIKELNDDDYEKLYDGYKAYIAASSDEEEEEENFDLDPSINYNEVTDEEEGEEEEGEEEEETGSDDDNINAKNSKKRSLEDDDFFSKPEIKREKPTLKDIKLPQLATGYYSGGESDDDIKDSLVDEITAPRKNRRGQRARQKIWEKKYGSGAKHVVKQQERAKSDRETLRLEYEARKAKREIKQREREERDKLKEEKKKKQQEKTIHPSWEAKMKAQESMKLAKFQGKKITFD